MLPTDPLLRHAAPILLDDSTSTGPLTGAIFNTAVTSNGTSEETCTLPDQVVNPGAANCNWYLPKGRRRATYEPSGLNWNLLCSWLASLERSARALIAAPVWSRASMRSSPRSRWASAELHASKMTTHASDIPQPILRKNWHILSRV